MSQVLNSAHVLTIAWKSLKTLFTELSDYLFLVTLYPRVKDKANAVPHYLPPAVDILLFIHPNETVIIMIVALIPMSIYPLSSKKTHENLTFLTQSQTADWLA